MGKIRFKSITTQSHLDRILQASLFVAACPSSYELPKDPMLRREERTQEFGEIQGMSYRAVIPPILQLLSPIEVMLPYPMSFLLQNLPFP